MSDETPAERVSRFREHTNTNSSIRAPPPELWKDVGIETLLDNYNDENNNTPAVRRPTHPRKIMEPTGHRKSPSNAAKAAAAARAAGSTPHPRKQSDAAATVATAEGTFGRFSRVFTNMLGGVLGKRKHSAPSEEEDAAQAALDDRKRAAEEAYHLAKAQGLLPAPKVFVRPGMTPRAWSAGTSSIASRGSIRVVGREGETDLPRWSSEQSERSRRSSERFSSERSIRSSGGGSLRYSQSSRSRRWDPETETDAHAEDTRKRRKISVEAGSQ